MPRQNLANLERKLRQQGATRIGDEIPYRHPGASSDKLAGHIYWVPQKVVNLGQDRRIHRPCYIVRQGFEPNKVRVRPHTRQANPAFLCLRWDIDIRQPTSGEESGKTYVSSWVQDIDLEYLGKYMGFVICGTKRDILARV